MKFSNLILSLSLFFLIMAVSPAQSATIHVPADQPTIQAGINAAIPGDTVLVADGTYTGTGNRDIDFGGKGVLLKSENGPDFTIIDCQGDSLNPHRGFYFHSGEDSSAVVDGFTIQSGYGLYDDAFGLSRGGGIKCDSSSSPKIINNTISGNSAGTGGGGIYCRNSNPTITNNTISENSARFSGGGINCDRSSPTINNNTISGNSVSTGGGGITCFRSNPSISNNIISGNFVNFFGGGIICFGGSDPTISNNTISGNSARQGGGIFCFDHASPTISNNTISDNSASEGGGINCENSSNPTISNNTISGNSASTNGSGLFLGNNSSPTVEHSVLAFNSGSEAIWCDDVNSVPTLTCCDVYGNSGGDWVGCIANQLGTNGNFSLDPLFCDSALGDYQLRSSFSPCLPQHSPCGLLVGALGLGCSGAFFCADANGDSMVNVDDVDFLIDFYFYGGITPFPYFASDLNCDGSVNIADITYLAAFLNGTGAAPCCAQ